MNLLGMNDRTKEIDMKWLSNKNKLFAVALAVALAAAVGVPAGAFGQSASVAPEADQSLRAMCDFMAGLEQFSVQTDNTLEVVLHSGQKIQFDNPADLSVKRPNRFRAERRGDLVDQTFYYDGKMLTLFMKNENLYAAAAAPPTIEEAIDFARESLDLFAPGGDLVYKNSYDILMEDVVSGFYVGLSVVGGVKCHHLAYRGNETDWQIWIEAGDKPLPKKFIITSKWMTGAPQFAIHVRSWDLDPKFDDATFQFTPPDKAQETDFILSDNRSVYGRQTKGEQP